MGELVVEVGCKSLTERQVVSVICRIIGTYCSQMHGLRNCKITKKGRIAKSFFFFLYRPTCRSSMRLSHFLDYNYLAN